MSERALARRASQGVAVDSTDLPVCRAYIERLESQGGKYISSSKWNNTVLMQVPDEAVALRFLDNSFVRSIQKSMGISRFHYAPQQRQKGAGKESVEKAG